MSYEFTAPVKDPDSRLDYEMDWTDWLREGETITAFEVFNASAPGLTIGAVFQANGKVVWRVSGGILGAAYIVTCRVTTSADRADDRSVRFRVGQR